MAAEELDRDVLNPQKAGPEQYAPRHRRGVNVVEVSQNSVEAEIHDLVRRGIGQLPQQRTEADATGNPAAKDMDLVIGRAVGESMEEIDRLITELQSVRNMLRQEGERLSREVANYVGLNNAVRIAMKTISESLTQWQTPGREANDRNDPAS